MINRVDSFKLNTAGNDYVVGDIHGCYSLLESTLLEVGFNKAIDRLFCVGDLVDRGPESEMVLDYLAQPWFFSVLGNHDKMAIDHYNAISNDFYTDAYIYTYNGGGWFINLDIRKQKCIADALSELPMAIEVETVNGLVGIIHASTASEDWHITRSMVEDHNNFNIQIMLWDRIQLHYKNNFTVANVHKVYHGHSITKNTVVLGNRRYIDTGGFKSGKLTMEKL